MFPTQNRIRRNRRLDEFEAPLGQALGAMAEETWVRSPLSSYNRSRELAEAQYGANGLGNFLMTGEIWSDPDSPMVGAEEARRRVGEEGLDLSIPDSGIRERALDILIDRKKQERRRQDILSRSPEGLGAGSLKLATALGVSLLDPVNVAASFVPIVGPARYSALLAKAGGSLARAGVRARVGVVEGIAGQALVEPLVYGAARQEQADYGLADSFINITFGGVMGGGLHVGGGAIADAVARRLPLQTLKPVDGPGVAIETLPHEARSALLRASVAQAIEGRVTRIDGLLDLAQGQSPRRTDLLSSTALGRIDADRTGDAPRSGIMDRVAAREAPADAARLPVGGVDQRSARQVRADRALADAGHDLTRLGEAGQDVNTVMREASPEAAARAVQVQEIASLSARVAELETLQPVKNLYGPGLLRNKRAAADDDVFEYGMRALTQPERERELSAAHERLASLREATDRSEIDGRVMESVRLGRELDAARPDRSSGAADRVREDARTSMRPESVRLADLDASERGDAQLSGRKGDELTRLQGEADQAVADLTDASRILGAEEDARLALAEFDGLAARAEEYGRAVKAAAECSLRRGV